jgi:Tol biopolymer transport system component
MRFIRDNWGLLLGAGVVLLIVVVGSYQLAQRRQVGQVDTAQDTIAFRSSRDGNFEIYAWTLEERKANRITSNPLEDSNPVYSADGRLLAYESWFNNQPEIYVADAVNGVGGAITNNEAFDTEPDWNPDGQRIAFISDREGTASVYVINRQTDETLRISGNEGIDASPAWSPDGRELIFASNRAGTFDLYRVNLDTCQPPADGNPLTPQSCTISAVLVDGADNIQPDWSPRRTAGCVCIHP